MELDCMPTATQPLADVDLQPARLSLNTRQRVERQSPAQNLVLHAPLI